VHPLQVSVQMRLLGRTRPALTEQDTVRWNAAMSAYAIETTQKNCVLGYFSPDMRLHEFRAAVIVQPASRGRPVSDVRPPAPTMSRTPILLTCGF